MFNTKDSLSLRTDSSDVDESRTHPVPRKFFLARRIVLIWSLSRVGVSRTPPRLETLRLTTEGGQVVGGRCALYHTLHPRLSEVNRSIYPNRTPVDGWSVEDLSSRGSISRNRTFTSNDFLSTLPCTVFYEGGPVVDSNPPVALVPTV